MIFFSEFTTTRRRLFLLWMKSACFCFVMLGDQSVPQKENVSGKSGFVMFVTKHHTYKTSITAPKPATFLQNFSNGIKFFVWNKTLSCYKGCFLQILKVWHKKLIPRVSAHLFLSTSLLLAESYVKGAKLLHSLQVIILFISLYAFKSGVFNLLTSRDNFHLPYNPAGCSHCRLQNHHGHIKHHHTSMGGSPGDVGEVPMTYMKQRKG